MENPAPEDASLKGEWPAFMVPPGSIQDRGMCEEKRTDDRPAEGGALNSGRLVFPPFEPIYLQKANVFQRKEGCATGHQDSDPLIVVGDGNTVHMAKGRAERQRGQSTHARGLSCPGQSVSSTLSALRTKAEAAPKHRFRDLFGLIDQQRLCEAYHHLKKRAAPGIDGVTHAEYGENLAENLRDLETRLREGRYRAQHVKRQWIAKAGSTKMRPLGIPVLEDKIVQQAVRMILEPIWEADFCDESIGYRPGRQARQSTLDLGVALDSGIYRWVVEADIKGFFDHIDHDWLCRMLEERIDDRRLVRLIRKWLKAGVLEEGRVTRSTEGTPQGGVICFGPPHGPHPSTAFRGSLRHPDPSLYFQGVGVGGWKSIVPEFTGHRRWRLLNVGQCPSFNFPSFRTPAPSSPRILASSGSMIGSSISMVICRSFPTPVQRQL